MTSINSVEWMMLPQNCLCIARILLAVLSQILLGHICSDHCKPWDFAGGPVVKTLCLQCGGHWFDPWSGKFHMLCHMAKKIKFLKSYLNGTF